MPSKAIYQCDWCRKDFTARTADRARGWARFCSKSCKAKRQEKRTGQNSAYQAHQAEREMEDLNDDPSWDAHKEW